MRDTVPFPTRRVEATPPGIGSADKGPIGRMARRIDFCDDPAAPAASSLVPSVNVVVTSAAGDVLLIRRSDNQNWAVPGGAIGLGESMVQAAVRLRPRPGRLRSSPASSPVRPAR